MRRIRSQVPLVVALLALVVALGGNAIANPVAQLAKAINGKTIKKSSIPGNRLKADGVTGKQVKESTLAVVPRAALADKATTADKATAADKATTATTADKATTATTADKATTATSATTAATADAVKSLRTFKLVTVASGAEADLITQGPLTIHAACTVNGGTLWALVSIATTEDHSSFAGDDNSAGDFGPATPLDARTIEFPGASSGGPPETSDGYDDTFDAFTPSGTSIGGMVHSWVSKDDGICKFHGYIVVTG